MFAIHSKLAREMTWRSIAEGTLGAVARYTRLECAMTRPTTLERAFDLARTGKFASIEQIKQRLRAEGYDINQIIGPYLKRQLRQTIDDSSLGDMRPSNSRPEAYSASASTRTFRTHPAQR